MPDEAEGFTRFGVEGSREVRSLRLADAGAAAVGSPAAGEPAAGSLAEAGRVDVEATGAAATSVCSGGVDRGEGALSEMLLVRRYIPESCRFSSSKFCRAIEVSRVFRNALHHSLGHRSCETAIRDFLGSVRKAQEGEVELAGEAPFVLKEAIRSAQDC